MNQSRLFRIKINKRIALHIQKHSLSLNSIKKETMLQKTELVERIINSCYAGEMPEDAYKRIFETLMSKPDRFLIDTLAKRGLIYEKLANYFICKN